MKEITDDDVKKVRDSAIFLSFQQIFDGLKVGRLPNVNPIILNNGYGAGISIDHYENKYIKRKINHLYITNPNGDVDSAIADKMALIILGKGYEFIGPMSSKYIFHYMKE